MTRPAVKVYKPNSKIERGSAFQFQRGLKRGETPVVFVEAVNQTKPKPAAGSTESPFVWDNKVTIMLNAGELAEIAAVVQALPGSKNEISLVHKTDAGVSGMKLTRPAPDDKYGNWAVSVSKKPADGEATTVRGFLTVGEMYQVVSLADYVIRENSIDLTRKS